MTFYKDDPRIHRGGQPPKYKLGRKWNIRYSRAKAQALFRDEGWDFNSTSWYKLWTDSGVSDQVGKKSLSYCMVRKNPEAPWAVNNCIIIQRITHCQRSGREHFNHKNTKRIGGAYYGQKESAGK